MGGAPCSSLWSQAGILVPTPRLAHLGAGGLTKVEMAFFSCSGGKGIEGDGGLEGWRQLEPPSLTAPSMVKSVDL